MSVKNWPIGLHCLPPASEHGFRLNNAYGSAMALIHEWDFDRPYGMEDFNNYHDLYEWCLRNPLSLGSIRLSFEFREDVNYPCFPIQTMNGPVHVKKGITTVTLQEFVVGYPLLKFVNIHSVQLFRSTDKPSILAQTIRDLIEQRIKAKKLGDKTEESILKLLVNSGYGKHLQGISKNSGKTTQYYNENGKLQKSRMTMPESSITNPFIGSWITGLVRAVIAEYLNYIDRNYSASGDKCHILSITTDGFMVAGIQLTELEMEGLGVYGHLLSKFWETIQGDAKILTLKHGGEGFSVLKNRAYAIHEKTGEPERLFACTGISLRGKELQEKIKFIRDEIASLTRFKDTKYTSSRLNSIDKWLQGEPYGDIEDTKSFNFDYDWKRQPDMDTLTDKNGRLFFKTTPHETVEDFLSMREDYDNFKRGVRLPDGGQACKNKITRAEEMREFMEYRKSASLPTTRKRVTTKLRLKIAAGILNLEGKASIRQLQELTGIPKSTLGDIVKTLKATNNLEELRPQVTEEYNRILTA